MTLNVEDLDKERFVLTFFNLEPDKDFADLMSSTIEDSRPSSARLLDLPIEKSQGESSELNVAVNKRPVYLVCW